MALRTGQPNFSKGVISDELVARIDVAAYASGLRRADNVILLKYGGVTKRPGTRLVAEVYADQGVRLMPFQFSLTQTYVLEMGQGYMRPAASGGLILEEQLTIADIVPGATTMIEAAYHDYDAGDQVYFDGVEGMVELNGRIGRVLSAPDTDHFEVDVDSSGFGAFTGDAGGTTRAGSPPAPPVPPPVPPPSPPPPPPPTGGGGGGGNFCVADDTPILLADGREIEARFLEVGMMLRTRHETTLEWGDYPVEAVSFAWQPVLIADGVPRATGDHRFWFDRGGWVRMRDLGVPDGKAWVARITVADAHTYVSAGVLSHNIKERMPDE
jgi:hypothetical protein